ncbi:MAG: lactonase family protein [Opitutaceae bacterium]|nr:lactonase family protein [Opitutaceae bacterium]
MTPQDPRNLPSISRRNFLARSFGAMAAISAIGSTRASGMQESPARTTGRRTIAYVGTFTRGTNFAEPYNASPGNGLGIHRFEMDPATGSLSARDVLVDDSSPNCLAFNPARTHLYVTKKGSGGAGSGAVSSFAVDPSDGRLKLLNTVSAGGLGPTHLSVHPSGRHVFVANYIGGSVAVLPVRPNGELGEATDVKELRGEVGPVHASSAPKGSFAISGHDKSHAHMIQPDPAGRFVLAANLGLDRIHVWKFDERGGTLLANDSATVALPPGDGPRHFAFHPNGRWLYSFQEEGSTIVWFDYDAATGRLSARQTLSTLPRGFTGSSFGSGIMVSPDGKFVYAANRLHDSIAWFAIAESGSLTLVATEWTRGDYPRSLNFDPSGAFLYSCNQRSDAITCFRIDRNTGALAFTGDYTAVGSPSVIAFLELGNPLP